MLLVLAVLVRIDPHYQILPEAELDLAQVYVEPPLAVLLLLADQELGASVEEDCLVVLVVFVEAEE